MSRLYLDDGVCELWTGNGLHGWALVDGAGDFDLGGDPGKFTQAKDRERGVEEDGKDRILLRNEGEKRQRRNLLCEEEIDAMVLLRRRQKRGENWERTQVAYEDGVVGGYRVMCPDPDGVFIRGCTDATRVGMIDFVLAYVRVESSMWSNVVALLRQVTNVQSVSRLVRHDMTLGTKRASAVGIGKAVSAVAPWLVAKCRQWHTSLWQVSLSDQVRVSRLG
ncbi:hypothetical protein HAX54_014082 [Datura stramonium]|uniref:Uncharacterized protein n=1 Tax=Datura stramonium TaxID=4076 RepID=A0ABS8TQ32_DATST|nr:hypothetical protein [Datura stramonium]